MDLFPRDGAAEVFWWATAGADESHWDAETEVGDLEDGAGLFVEDRLGPPVAEVGVDVVVACLDLADM